MEFADNVLAQIIGTVIGGLIVVALTSKQVRSLSLIIFKKSNFKAVLNVLAVAPRYIQMYPLP